LLTEIDESDKNGHWRTSPGWFSRSVTFSKLTVLVGVPWLMVVWKYNDVTSEHLYCSGGETLTRW